MEEIREYLLSVTAAALLCSIVSVLMNNRGILGAAIKLLCGVFMALSVVGPWANIRLDSHDLLSGVISDHADTYVDSGKDSAQIAMADIIKEQTRTYILDKAKNLGVTLTVEVTLSQDDIPVPEAVSLCGSVSPYAKRVLTERIAEDLGIPAEDQLWISQS